MTDTDSRIAYGAALGMALGWIAYSMRLASGANALAFAALPAAAIVGYFLLESWRDSAGRSRFEPLVSYGVVVVFAAALFGWFFARSQWVSQLAALLGASLLIPVAITWFLERNTLKGDTDASVSESHASAEPE